ncbi:MAG: hypothetical protein IJB15_02290 [Clostridia bacterium]|nr:hypothetical protein [Clostridia bacterium]
MRRNVIIALLLAAMLLPTLASCGDSSAAQETSSAADTTVQETEKETTAEEARNAISDEIENEDFGGRNFIVLGSDEQDFGSFMYVEELTGEVLNDAVYARNL